MAALFGALALAGESATGSPGMSGKGVFIRSLDHAGGVDETVEVLVELGMSWCALETIHQEADRTKRLAVDDLARFVEACSARSIDVWIWGYGRPGRVAEFVADFAERLDVAPAIAGVGVNLEGPWIGNFAEQARTLVAELERIAGGRGLALTSFGGGPQSVPGFPWAEFGNRGWIGWPQIYDAKNSYGPGYPSTSVDRWRDVGFAAITVFWGAASAKDVTLMRGLADNTPPVPAVGWWDLYWILLDDDKRQFVANFPEGTEFRYA